MEETTKPIEPWMELSDPVFDDMAMSDTTNREQFRNVCFSTYNQQKRNFACEFMVFEEWKVLLSILQQIGYWDIRDKHAAQLFFPIFTIQLQYMLDDEKESRICKMTVTGTRSLPKGLHRLDRLECLSIEGNEITSLPLQELTNIPKLKRLELHGASKVLSDSLCGLPETEKLTRV
jgi:Leucine-rich repeat (LRR) protein